MGTAIVVGGGLASMVVARELALRRWRVILLERSKRLGGKAGSDIKDGRLVEHGYHVFPKWYPNVRAIVDRIGVRLIDFDRYHFLLPGPHPADPRSGRGAGDRLARRRTLTASA
ncbi:MAG: FAD-dependent oxidoreductase [Bryobacteraceae bacterium]